MLWSAINTYSCDTFGYLATICDVLCNTPCAHLWSLLISCDVVMSSNTLWLHVISCTILQAHTRPLLITNFCYSVPSFMVVRFHSFVVNSNHLMINIHLESRHGELFDLLGAGQSQSLKSWLCNLAAWKSQDLFSTNDSHEIPAIH